MSTTRIYAMVMRQLYLWPRTIERLMGTFWWPLFDLIIWGLTTLYLQKASLVSFSLVTFIIGGLIFWNIVSRSQSDISVNFLDEAWNKNLINIFSTPLTQSEFMVSMMILGAIKLLITLISMIALSLLLYKFNFLSQFGLFIPVLALNLLLFGWSFGFFINGLILRFGYTIQDFAWGLIALIQPFSCVFYPLSSLPPAIQKVARFLPTTYVFEEMRRILQNGHIKLENLVISFILNIIYLLLSLGFFKLMFEYARENGKLVKLN